MSTAQKPRMIVIDDDAEMRALMRDFFTSRGFEVTLYSLASEALKVLLGAQKTEVDVVISDINMPELNGLDFAGEFHQRYPDVPIILITAFGSIETAIEAMKRGAFDYIVKPFKLSELAVNVDRALEHRALRQDNRILREQLKKDFGLGKIIGKSPSMLSIFDLVKRVCNAQANVLITGESGTGKEVIARAIHDLGNRRNQPFVAINCTAIPESLLESELFGHAKGSFTGAVQRKKGLFEEANGGTLFLDEIGDMQPSLQSKLLRVIQEQKIRSVGDNQDRDIDVRIVAATHKDLAAAIRDGLFRGDLFYRLSVIPIAIPPLRQRKEDIPLLAEHFLRRAAAVNNSPVRGFTSEALHRLTTLPWPGNVRELENVIERAVVLATGTQIGLADLPESEPKNATEFVDAQMVATPTIEQIEKRYIEFVLNKTGGRKEKAAQILGIDRKTLYRKERQYGLVNPTSHEDWNEAAEEEDSI